MRFLLLAIPILVWGARAAPAAAPTSCTTDGRYVMGTVLQLEVCAADDELVGEALASSFATAAHLDALLTTYSGTSPTNRLNARAGAGATVLPPEVVEVLALSREYAVLTGGTFDVTVGPLIALWREAGERGAPPSPAMLAQARARVGSERIVLGGDGRWAALSAGGMAVDFGGIGKGYALDRIAARLEAAGVASGLLDFGRSSIRALGGPPDSPGWRLLLRHPSRGAIGVVTLRDRAMSISGSLAQGPEIAGRRYGHVIDPRTGRPLERDLLAAVVAPSAASAEALSKALLLLGEEDGIALLGDLAGVEALLADADGSSWATPGWADAVAFAPRAGVAGAGSDS